MVNIKKRFLSFLKLFGISFITTNIFNIIASLIINTIFNHEPIKAMIYSSYFSMGFGIFIMAIYVLFVNEAFTSGRVNNEYEMNRIYENEATKGYSERSIESKRFPPFLNRTTYGILGVQILLISAGFNGFLFYLNK